VRAKAFIFLAATLGLAFAVMQASPTSNADTASVSTLRRVAVEDNFFEPRSLSVPKGAAVTWYWKGDNFHNVTFTKVPRGTSRRSADTRRRGRFRRSFQKRGVYRYICTLQYGMTGTIYVTGATATGG
jgi:plastocyanin